MTHLVSYRSEEAKQAVKRGEISQMEEDPLLIETWPCGWDKRTAAVKFYNVCLEAMDNPLVSRVIMMH
jgi:hypothetical protein